MGDICPYAKSGVCNACRVLKIDCDGKRFGLCTQYQIATGKITPEEVGKSRCPTVLSDSLSNIDIQEKCKYCEYYYNFICRADECVCDDK